MAKPGDTYFNPVTRTKLVFVTTAESSEGRVLARVRTTQFFRANLSHRRPLARMINGTAGAIVYMDDEIDHALTLAVDGEKITAIYLVRNPDKLRHVAAVQSPQA